MFRRKYINTFLEEQFKLVKSAFDVCNARYKEAEKIRSDELNSPYGKVSESTAQAANSVVAEGYEELEKILKQVLAELETKRISRRNKFPI